MGGRASHLARAAGLIEAAAVFVFLYQALRTLFSMLFGLLYDAVFAGTAPLAGVVLAFVFILLACLVPLAAPRRPRPARIAMLAAAVLAFVARIALTFDVPQGRLVASIVILAAAGLYLALLLRSRARDAAQALILALIVDLLVRTAGQSFDPTLRTGWWPGQVAVSLALCLLAGWRYRFGPAQEQETGGAPGGLLIGLLWAGWLFLETSLLAFPRAVAALGLADSAHASSVAYCVVSAGLPVFTLLVVQVWGSMPRGLRAALLGLLVVALALAYLAPGDSTSVWLLLAHYAAVSLLLEGFWPRDGGRQERVGPAVALGNVLFLVLSFVYAFTFTYAYTLDLFRGLALPVFVVAGLLVGVPVLVLPAAALPQPSSLRSSRAQRLGVLALAVAVSLLAGLLHGGEVDVSAGPGRTIRAATYNIHYGYDSDWHVALEAQAQAIEAAGADVVTLQEVDTGRPTSYMIDDLHWLSRRLHMEAVYLPTLEGQSGIGLLSRFPIIDSERLLLPSELEQTGILRAEILVDGQHVSAYAIWLGLEPEERARQLDAALPWIAAHEGPALFGGDFNSTPDSPVYARIAAAGFVDPFATLGLGSPPTDPAIEPDKRIDFVWLRGLMPISAAVSGSLASDHRLVVVEATLP